MSLPPPFVNDMNDDDRSLWELISAHIDQMSDRQLRRAMDREPVDNAIQNPLGTLVDIDGVIAEQAQQKQDMKQLTATIKALWTGQLHLAAKNKILLKQNEELKKKIAKLSP